MHLHSSVRRTAAALGVAITAAALVTAPAQAVPEEAPGPGTKYVALGSSYAAGASVGPADPSDKDGLCGRTMIAYPNLVARTLGLDLTNATCGGATTDNITTVPQKVSYPASGTLAPQINAVTADTDLVTITIGGNDVNFVGNLYAESCLADLAANPSSPLSNALKEYGLCTPLPDETVTSALAAMESKLTRMVEAVQARAPKARIILIDYPVVLPENGKPCSAVPITQERQKFLNQVARQLSNATKHAAQKTGTEFVAASKNSRGQDACSTTPWMTGYDFSPGVAAMHPNEAGHAAVAAALTRQLTTAGKAS
ncbi:SGNH/GDSL hydrolase family protein [Arthrobacter sp. OY3WO11]|uniref:SGNH/GDSL hydrolase family protein n=1 Tax=Arthrobacter sp. OY3WO11 TaxID=1835723 RepID=UPI0007CF0150|nr:SGNH/GDSL hydrolase family protein [Arthrobacter sp. OY3WO11]OAD97630.1 hypothetical protein A6A22_19635 [Arthrobacter sp. OY3WO11]